MKKTNEQNRVSIGAEFQTFPDGESGWNWFRRRDRSPDFLNSIPLSHPLKPMSKYQNIRVQPNSGHAQNPSLMSPSKGTQKNMDTTTQVAPKKLTITLTDARPVTILAADWPVIASAKWADHDNQYECQANRLWSAWLKVRQHADGRTIVYGSYHYSTQYQHESDATYRDGMRLTETTPAMAEIVAAIRTVGESLAGRSGHVCWAGVIAGCIADLPAEELA